MPTSASSARSTAVSSTGSCIITSSRPSVACWTSESGKVNDTFSPSLNINVDSSNDMLPQLCPDTLTPTSLDSPSPNPESADSFDLGKPTKLQHPFFSLRMTRSTDILVPLLALSTRGASDHTSWRMSALGMSTVRPPPAFLKTKPLLERAREPS